MNTRSFLCLLMFIGAGSSTLTCTTWSRQKPRTDLEVKARFDTFLDICNGVRPAPVIYPAPNSGRSLCLGVQNTKQLAFCRNTDQCPFHRILLHVATGDSSISTKIHLIGGYKFKYIAFGFTNGPDKEIAMASGAPAFLCGFGVGKRETFDFRFGYLTSQYKFEPFVPGSSDPNEPFYNKLIASASVTLVDGLIECDFELAENLIHKLPGTPGPGNPINIEKEPVNLMLAQGWVTYGRNGIDPCPGWIANPLMHDPNHRHKSMYKFTLKEKIPEIVKLYRACGDDDRYCFGYGAEGCMSLFFRCRLFVSITRILPVVPPGSPPPPTPGLGGSFQIKVDADPDAFTSFVGVGFSGTDWNAQDQRITSLQYLIMCEKSSLKAGSAYTVPLFRLTCSGTTCNGVQDSSLSTTITGNRGDIEGEGRLGCIFDMGTNFPTWLFANYTVLLLGSNITYTGSSPLTFELPAAAYNNSAYAAFAPHRIQIGGQPFIRKDLIIYNSHQGEDDLEMDKVLALNPTERSRASYTSSAGRLIVSLMAFSCINLK